MTSFKQNKNVKELIGSKKKKEKKRKKKQTDA